VGYGEVERLAAINNISIRVRDPKNYQFYYRSDTLSIDGMFL